MHSSCLDRAPLAGALTRVEVLPDTGPSHPCLQLIMIIHLRCSSWSLATVLNGLITSTCGSFYYGMYIHSLIKFLKMLPRWVALWFLCIACRLKYRHLSAFLCFKLDCTVGGLGTYNEILKCALFTHNIIYSLIPWISIRFLLPHKVISCRLDSERNMNFYAQSFKKKSIIILNREPKNEERLLLWSLISGHD